MESLSPAGSGRALDLVISGNGVMSRYTDAFRRKIRAAEIFLRCKWLHAAAEIARSPITDPEGPVVSLTSYGERVSTVHIAIESIARGKRKPSRIILWLDYESARHLPRPLLKQERRGLEIRVCRDLGPHKKYYPYLQSCGSITVPLVTADDDLIYPRWWLERLIDEWARHPDVLNCYRARRMHFDGLELTSYKEWELTNSSEPSFLHFAGSGAGAILPISLQETLREAGMSFLECCPRADDIWLHVHALRSGYRVRQIREREFRLIEIPGSQSQALWYENLKGDGNDQQIAATYTARDVEMLRSSEGPNELVAAERHQQGENERLHPSHYRVPATSGGPK